MAEPISSASVGSLSNQQKDELYPFFKKSPTSSAGATHEALKNYIKEASLPARHSRRSVLLNADTKLINTTNPAIFKYLNEQQLNALEEKLTLSFYGLCDRYQSHVIEGQRQNLKQYYDEIEDCSYLIRNITLARENKALEKKEVLVNNEVGLKKWLDQKCKLLLEWWASGFTVSQLSELLIQLMSDANVWRMYWVWAGNFLRTTLDLIPDGFYNKQQTVDITTNPQTPLGYVSWILYYVRFLINFMLVLKHSIVLPGEIAPWMSDEEKRMVLDEKGRWSRFKEQLAIRKFTLINDLIWATTNLLCFFWLLGPALGPLGDFLTVMLLVGDASLCVWARTEATAEHKKDIDVYINEIQLLEDSKTSENSKIVEIQIEEMKLAQQQCEFDWKYKNQKVTTDVIYGIGLVVSYAALVFPWVSIGIAASGMVLGASAGLFVISLIYSTYKAYIDVSQARKTQITALKQCECILTQITAFEDSKLILTDIDKRKLNEVNLRYKDLTAEADYQEKLADYHLYTLVRSAIVQSLIPLAIFAAFTFATFGIGAAVVGAGIVIAIITHYILEFQKPENAELAKLNPDENNTFVPSVEIAKVNKKLEQTKKSGYLGLFSNKKENDSDIGEPAIGQQP